jgi:hypothetical protein
VPDCKWSRGFCRKGSAQVEYVELQPSGADDADNSVSVYSTDGQLNKFRQDPSWRVGDGDCSSIRDAGILKRVQDFTPYHLDDWTRATDQDKVAKDPESFQTKLKRERRRAINALPYSDEADKQAQEIEAFYANQPHMLTLYAPAFDKQILRLGTDKQRHCDNNNKCCLDYCLEPADPRPKQKA